MMKLDEALLYVDSLDAVDAGVFNSVQAIEVDAIVTGVRQYLDGLSAKVAGFKQLRANLAVFSAVVGDAVKESIDGKDPLPEPRVKLPDPPEPTKPQPEEPVE